MDSTTQIPTTEIDDISPVTSPVITPPPRPGTEGTPVVCDKPYTTTDKWTASVLSGLSFLIISSPATYAISDSLLESALNSKNTISSRSGNPTPIGLLVHAAIYVVTIRLMMEKKSISGCRSSYDAKDKLITSTVAGVLYLMVSSPIFYRITNSMTSRVGLDTIQPDGTPNVQGLLLHTMIFTLITRVLIR